MTHQPTPAFNLLDEQWIPVRTSAGAVREVSLTSALLDSADYSALAETSPPNLIALYRLLLAVLHRALTIHHGPWKDSDRARWYGEGLPVEPVRAYLKQWRERFWLFHPVHPFMQVPALAEAEKTKNKLKPWTQLALERSGGDTPLLFDRSLDLEPESVSYAVALRNLIGYLQFTPGGLVKTFKTSDFAGPLASTVAILPVGQSLSDTLALNLHPFLRDSISDLPAWEMPPPKISDALNAPTLPTGHNDRYSRLTRFVLFVPTAQSGSVNHLRFSEGLGMGVDHLDPMVCCCVVDGIPIRISFSEGRSVWRDLPSMVPDTTGQFDIQAATIGWATDLREMRGVYSENLTVLAAGWKNAKRKAAKIVRWRLDQVELPHRILHDSENGATLRYLVRYAENFFSDIRGVCSGMIAAAMPDSNHKDTKARAKAILDNGPTAAVFFSAAERGLPELMQRIATGDGDATHRYWMETLHSAARTAWEAACRVLGNSPAALRAEARAHPKFQRLLHTLEHPQETDARPEVNP